jgi:hypothetical protein
MTEMPDFSKLARTFGKTNAVTSLLYEEITKILNITNKMASQVNHVNDTMTLLFEAQQKAEAKERDLKRLKAKYLSTVKSKISLLNK